MRKVTRLRFAVIAGSSSVLLFFGTAEIVLRLVGYEPFNLTKRRFVSVEPGGKKYQEHPSLGYAHIPGRFKVTLHGTLSHTMTHRTDGLRITHPTEYDRSYVDKEKVWIMGCSFTHGNSLNDHETYPWLLQQRYPGHEFVNFGVDGYGTIQSLIQLRDNLPTMPKPKLVLVGYTSLHDERNTFANSLRKRRYRHSSIGPLVQPYARLDENGELLLKKADSTEYRPWPLATHSALVNLLQDSKNALQDQRLDSHAVTKAIIKRMHEICLDNGIELIVVNLWVPDDMRTFCEENGLPFVDAYVDLSWKENNNWPFDGHPSAFANWQYAQTISEFLDGREILGDPRSSQRSLIAARWYSSLGQVYMGQEYHRRAVAALERATALDSTLAAARGHLCLAYGQLEMWDEATDSCHKALELDANLGFARDYLGWIEQRAP